MKIEYLQDGSTDCPLIRIFDFNNTEANQLLEVFSDLMLGKIRSFAAHDMPFIDCIDVWRLTFYLCDEDEGVITTGDKTFEWRRSAEGWQETYELAAPFLADQKGFQWLDEKSHISVLVSKNGLW